MPGGFWTALPLTNQTMTIEQVMRYTAIYRNYREPTKKMLVVEGTVVRRTSPALEEQEFAGIVLDEAQNIKNHGTQATCRAIGLLT